MAIKVGSKFFLNPVEAYKLERAYRKTKQMVGDFVTRKNVRNQYLAVKYKVPNPDAIEPEGFASSHEWLPQLARVSTFRV